MLDMFTNSTTAHISIERPGVKTCMAFGC